MSTISEGNRSSGEILKEVLARKMSPLTIWG